MIDKMAEIFLDEANDLLDKLEDILLELEGHPQDAEAISSVFRIMHTIKGSSAMFGFTNISKFTHEVETAFDHVRNGRVNVSPQLITLTLQTRDHIRTLLTNEESDEISQKSKQLVYQFQQYVIDNNSEKKKSPVAAAGTTYRIRFEPSSEIFANGTRPHALIKELSEMGTFTVTPFLGKIPSLSDLDPTLCYVSWEIILTTTESLNTLKDVFIFLDDTSKIEITPIQVADELEEIATKKLGEILVEKHVATPTEIKEALNNQKPLGVVLTESKTVSAAQVQAALAEQQHLKEVQDKKVQETNIQTIKVQSDKLDKLIDLVGELVTFNARLGQLAQNIQNPLLSTLGEQGERLILELRDTTMDMRMLPIGSIFSRFRRLVRDLAADLGKNIELETEGADTELDKTVIEKLNDPLVHLIRNSVDHGIELPAVRQKAGKTPSGTVLLKAQHAGAFVLITIEDDGAGLNKPKILNKALEKGLINSTTEVNENDIADLIFLPGFSTAENVTSVSGRGVGMDVVKKDITALGGSVTCLSQEGKGTKFILKLPLTLAIIEGILVKIAHCHFVIPLSNVLECLEFERKGDNKICSSLNIRNEVVPYIDLRTFFEVSDPLPPKEQIVVVNDQDSKIGLLVDKVIGNYQTVIKPLGRLYKNVQGLSGATILGDGTVGLILDVYKLSETIRELDTHTTMQEVTRK